MTAEPPMADNLTDARLPEGWILTTLGKVTAPSSERVEPSVYPDAPYLSLEHIEPETNRMLGHGTGAEVR